jgi:hypothetical protein
LLSRNFSEVTAEKKQGIDQLFLENRCFSASYYLEGRKKQFQNAYKEPHEVVFIDRNSDVLAYMHYIGDSYPASLICLSRTHLLKNFHFTTWEEIYISDRTV